MTKGTRTGPALGAQARKGGKTIARRARPSPLPARPQQSDLVALIRQSLEDGKAEQIVVVDLHGKTSIADHLIIASGRSQRQLNAMATHIVDKLKASGLKTIPIEGAGQGDWILVDAGDVVVHLFRPDVRSHYNLEKMWGDDFVRDEQVAM